MDPKNILIFRIGHLGDTVVALPALWTLRQRFPQSRLTLLTNIDLGNPNYISPASILPAKGLMDNYMAYPTNVGLASKAAALVKLAAELRSRQFDTMIYLMPRQRTGRQIDRDRKFFQICGICELIGSDFLLKNRLDVPGPQPFSGTVRESTFLLEMLSDLGVKPGPEKTDLLLTQDEIDSAHRWITAIIGGSGDARLVAIAPGAKWKSKQWAEENYTHVVSRLVRDHNIFPVVFGGEEDRQTGDRMIGQWGRGANAAGILTVREAAALLRKCELYLGNDTGTMHLASAVGIPCVAVFAAVDWIGRWDPFGEKNRLFRARFYCEGCDLGSCVHQNHCLGLIKTDEVYKECSKLINGE